MSRHDCTREANRRRMLALLATSPMLFSTRAHPREITNHGSQKLPYAAVLPGRPLRFPQDEGSHPAFRTEWWYITGWLEAHSDAPFGFQITFFRTRLAVDGNNPSAFTPRQIVIAHAALSDASRGRLLHDQRVARAALELAGAEQGRLNVWVDEWTLRDAGSGYLARIRASDFLLDLSFTRTQPPLVQGIDGLSRKGPRPESASYYYSVPHLSVSGTVAAAARQQVRGTAWLDHEWSSSYMDERATGWDWIGINFDDSAALMVFRMRDAAGSQFWAGGSYRDAQGARRMLTPEEIAFVPLRMWRSPRTAISYPVAWRVRAGDLEIALEPLMDDQESDTRASVGTIYWEGAVRALREKKPVGRGYLELTGYGQRIRL